MPDKSERPPLDLDPTNRQARALNWVAFALGALGIVLAGLGALGVFEKPIMQVFSGLSAMSYGLCIYFAKKAGASPPIAPEFSISEDEDVREA